MHRPRLLAQEAFRWVVMLVQRFKITENLFDAVSAKVGGVVMVVDAQVGPLEQLRLSGSRPQTSVMNRLPGPFTLCFQPFVEAEGRTTEARTGAGTAGDCARSRIGVV